jgi:hypothetical protein
MTALRHRHLDRGRPRKLSQTPTGFKERADLRNGGRPRPADFDTSFQDFDMV